MQAEKIYIRALEPEDLEFIYLNENSPNIWQWGGQRNIFSKYDLMRFIESSHQDITITTQKKFVIVLKDGDKRVGTVDLYDYDAINRRVSLGLILYSSEQRGNGYGTETVEFMLKFCFEQLSVHQVYCEVQVSNNTSIALFEKCGFVCCGEKKDWVMNNGKWEDVKCFQCFCR